MRDPWYRTVTFRATSDGRVFGKTVMVDARHPIRYVAEHLGNAAVELLDTLSVKPDRFCVTVDGQNFLTVDEVMGELFPPAGPFHDNWRTQSFMEQEWGVRS